MVATVLIAALLVVVAIAAAVGIRVHREPTRKVRRKELTSARTAIADIDDLVDRTYSQLDLVGQAMADDIRALINQHRRETTVR